MLRGLYKCHEKRWPKSKYSEFTDIEPHFMNNYITLCVNLFIVQTMQKIPDRFLKVLVMIILCNYGNSNSLC